MEISSSTTRVRITYVHERNCNSVNKTDPKQLQSCQPSKQKVLYEL